MNIYMATHVYTTNSVYTGKQFHKYAHTLRYLRNNCTYAHTLHARYIKSMKHIHMYKFKNANVGVKEIDILIFEDKHMYKLRQK